MPHHKYVFIESEPEVDPLSDSLIIQMKASLFWLIICKNFGFDWPNFAKDRSTFRDFVAKLVSSAEIFS